MILQTNYRDKACRLCFIRFPFLFWQGSHGMVWRGLLALNGVGVGVDIDSRILRVKISLILKSSMEKLLYASQIKLANEMGVKGSEEILSISQIWS